VFTGASGLGEMVVASGIGVPPERQRPLIAGSVLFFRGGDGAVSGSRRGGKKPPPEANPPGQARQKQEWNHAYNENNE